MDMITLSGKMCGTQRVMDELIKAHDGKKGKPPYYINAIYWYLLHMQIVKEQTRIHICAHLIVLQ